MTTTTTHCDSYVDNNDTDDIVNYHDGDELWQ